MVFCGKPSKGCTNCRTRRIKCDLGDPACSQCERAGKACPGYRDPLALMFRDENARVIKKARVPRVTSSGEKNATRKDKKQANDTETPASEIVSSASETATLYTTSSPADSVFILSPTSHIPHALGYRTSLPLRVSSTNFDDAGIKFFFTHYVAVINPIQTGQLDLTSSPIWHHLFTNRTLYAAVSSVGLAGLSNVTKDQRLMLLARHKYAAAMKNVMITLKDPANADLEDTFKTVMMLAMFEVVNCSSEDPSTWGVHIDGAVAVLRTIAEKKPISSQKPGGRMQMQFCFSVFIRYFQSRQPFPAEFESWCRLCREAQKPKDYPASTLAGIVTRFIDVHASIKSRTLYDCDTIVRETLNLEAELDEWEVQLPPQWAYNVIDTTELDHNIFRNQYHVYRDRWTARIWNHYRWARILVNELLLRHLDKTNFFSTDRHTLRQKSLDVISKMAIDVCVSVSSQFFRNDVESARIRLVPLMNGIFLLLFPLAVAGSAIGAPEDLHNWVINMLEKIGHTLGVHKALKLIPMTKIRRQHWILDQPSYSPTDITARARCIHSSA